MRTPLDAHRTRTARTLSLVRLGGVGATLALGLGLAYRAGQRDWNVLLPSLPGYAAGALLLYAGGEVALTLVGDTLGLVWPGTMLAGDALGLVGPAAQESKFPTTSHHPGVMGWTSRLRHPSCFQLLGTTRYGPKRASCHSHGGSCRGGGQRLMRVDVVRLPMSPFS